MQGESGSNVTVLTRPSEQTTMEASLQLASRAALAMDPQ